MADYRKFEGIGNGSDSESEDAEQVRESRERQAALDDQRALHAGRKDQVDKWLKAKIRQIFPPQDGSGPPELDPWEDIPPRRVTDEERSALAMFLSVAHFEAHSNNLANHRDIMSIARQHRWLEEDPGTVELLCQVQRCLRSSGNSGAESVSGLDARMEDMVLSGLNTLAAPSRAGCSEGYGKIYELFAIIGDPKTSDAWNVREKYMKKEYAAEALFESLMPKTQTADGENGQMFSSTEWCIFFGSLLLVVLVVAVLIWRFSGAGVHEPAAQAHSQEERARGEL